MSLGYKQKKYVKREEEVLPHHCDWLTALIVSDSSHS